MTIKAKVIADSMHPSGQSRLTTMVLSYPRIVHSEFMTHRMFSRNAASSRAIPFRRMVKAVMSDVAAPVEWGSNQPGMQAGGQIRFPALARLVWGAAAVLAAVLAGALHSLGLHKQICNRLLEPFSHITVVVTGTDAAWSNFFHLRAHAAADPTLRAVAFLALEKYRNSVPTPLKIGEWHAPFAPEDGPLKDRVTQSMARCARVSYTTPDQPGKSSTLAEDRVLASRLIGSDPKHASPAEHQACPVPMAASAQGGNFGAGWCQHRHTLAGESKLDMFRNGGR